MMNVLLRRTSAIASRAWGWYSRALDTRPILTKGVTAFSIYTAADCIRQRYEYTHIMTPAQRAAADGWWDVPRTLRLSFWYMLVHAPYIHTWFGVLDKFYGVGPGFALALKKALTDQLLSMPVYLGVTLYSTSRMAGFSHDDAVIKWKRDWWPTVKGAGICWIPALAVNFLFVPAKYRLLFINIVMVPFGVFMSKMVNRPLHDDDEDGGDDGGDGHAHVEIVQQSEKEFAVIFDPDPSEQETTSANSEKEA